MKEPTTTAKSGGIERYLCNLMNINHWLYWPFHERKKKKKKHPDKFMAGSTYAARNIFAYIFHTQHMAVIQIARAKC